MTRDDAKALRGALEKVLAEIAPGLGYKLQLGKCTFGETAVFKLECAPVNPATGVAVNKGAEVFKRYAGVFGLDPALLGKVIRIGGSTYTVTGLAVNRPKYPVTAVRHDGRAVKLTVADVNRGVAAPAATA